MTMTKSSLAEDTVIEVGKSIPILEYRVYFMEVTGKELSGWEFQTWLNTQSGKTLKKAITDYCKAVDHKGMKEILSEERFSIISDTNKAFITAFDNEIINLGYDFGGAIGGGYCWGKYMIIYAKAGVKSKNVIARIYIREDCIVLRLFFNHVDKHSAYIENAPGHIKEVFTGNYGNCSCNPKKDNCRMRKNYTIDNKSIEKCSGVVFEFWNPTVEKLPDYMDLLNEFYPAAKIKRAK